MNYSTLNHIETVAGSPIGTIGEHSTDIIAITGQRFSTARTK